MSETEPLAEEIALSLLKRTEEALFSDNFEAFLAVSALPFVSDTFEGKIVLTTVADLRAAFDIVAATNAANNITGYQRDLISASFTSAAEIKYAYVTRRLSGHMLADEAYPSIAVARLIGTEWKIASAQHAIEHAPEARQSSAETRSVEPIRKTAR